MTRKPTYEELEQRVGRLEKKIIQCKRVEKTLRESKDKYYNIFKNAAVPQFEINFDKLRVAFDNLKATGVMDFRKYLTEHPEFVRETEYLMEIIDINDDALRLYKAKNKKEVIVPISKLFSPELEPVVFQINWA